MDWILLDLDSNKLHSIWIELDQYDKKIENINILQFPFNKVTNSPLVRNNKAQALNRYPKWNERSKKPTDRS